MTDFAIIGKSIAMVDAAGKTTGAGKYADDFKIPGMLVGQQFCIRRIRTRASRASIRRAPKLSTALLRWSRAKTRRIPTASCLLGTTKPRLPSVRFDM